MKKKAEQKRAIVEEIATSLDDIDARLTELLKKAHQLRAVLHHVEEAAARLPKAEELQHLRELAGEIAEQLRAARQNEDRANDSTQTQGAQGVKTR